MKALLATGNSADLVALGDVAEPIPEPQQAVIKVEYFSPNRGETFLLEKPRPNWRPGKDIAGVVVRAAQDGSGPAVGQRVVAHPPALGWAELAAVGTDRIVELPGHVLTKVAAALPLAGLTALRVLRASGDLIGRKVLLTSASGGVGHYIVELAAASGAEITAISATPERAAQLRRLGAAHIVHDVTDAVGPFDLVLEGVGGAVFPAAFHHLGPRGHLIWFGQASRTPISLDFFGYWDGPTSGTIRRFDVTDSDVSDHDDLATLVRMASEDRLHPEIGLVARWQDTSTVLNDLRNRKIRGNAVVAVSID